MTPSRKKICKNIARGSHVALARRCLENSEIRKCIVRKIGHLLRKEVAQLCSNGVKSVLLDKTNHMLKSFKWNSLMDEIASSCPILLAILQSCTKVPRSNSQHEVVIGVITALLCKNRRSSASLIQRLISVILYTGHASKRVSSTFFFFGFFMLGHVGVVLCMCVACDREHYNQLQSQHLLCVICEPGSS